ncbi:glycoside hydrolase family 36 protein [Bifidobacterium cuniculi]|uniref:Glycosidase n=1 Tax=Bifidobacterium cuniculi TaxID=1688 RepID=A0A087AZL2_9BIFI|nr:glycoside hydrolase family 36 protein [Bifidobacterium cuniculi]KFI64212.1 glycosidase [Bifidobacterium cuniculi]
MEQKLTHLQWGNDLLALTLGWDDATPVHLTHIRSAAVSLHFTRNIPIVEIMTARHGHWEASDRLIHTTLGASMRVISSRQWQENGSRFLNVMQESIQDGVQATLQLELPDGCVMFRSTVEIRNTGTEVLSLESVTSWATLLGSPDGMSPDPGAWNIAQCRQEWLSEGRWGTKNLRELFPVISQGLTGHDPRSKHAVVSTGTWSTGNYLPMTLFISKYLGAAWFMQIEHNGAWRWETGDCTRDAYMATSGPTFDDHAWSHELQPNETFRSVPASVSVADTMQTLAEQVTAYRRTMNTAGDEIRHPHVIFNDYMNTINGDPTTQKLLPLVDAAAQVGCEVFCIDCGWYDDSGDWWPTVGEWKPSVTRFPNGLEEVTDTICAKGMIPGLWLEPEVIGVNSPVAEQLPDEAFFCRRGHRIVEQERYILDFSHPAAVSHLDSVIDHLIRDCSIGYFKFDCNVSPGAGTDIGGISPGAGMLRHLRAYNHWIDDLHRRYPDLILENCSSGGMREDFAQTSRFQVQSTSDQQDCRLYPAIAAAAPLAILPEQAANWAYPQASMDKETSAFTLVTTMLGRFFLSGYLNRMDTAQRALCAEAVRTYTQAIRPRLSKAFPFWPLGLPQWTDHLMALGMKDSDTAIVALWARRLDQGERVRLPIPHLQGVKADVTTLFPTQSGFGPWHAQWEPTQGLLTVDIPACNEGARIFQLTMPD